MEVKIYTITHKIFNKPDDKIYVPIVAGAFEYDKKAFPKDYIRDDMGDNISNKHDLYSEYTALYWIYKNSNADIVGINHYRRYFINANWIRYLKCLCNFNRYFDKYLLKEKDILDFFDQGYNCILPKKYSRTNNNLYEQYKELYNVELLHRVGELLQNHYPEMHRVYLDLLGSYDFYGKCIIILKKEDFDEYCAWWTNIINSIENSGYEAKEREYAYLMERIMNVWVEYKKRRGELRAKECFWVNTEYPIWKITSRISEFILPKWLSIFIRKVRNISKKREEVRS